jgi:hypothetical protein
MTAPVISPASPNITGTDTVQFTADQPVLWSCSAGTITPEGLFTPPNVTGGYRVTATNEGAESSFTDVLVLGIFPAGPSYGYSARRKKNVLSIETPNGALHTRTKSGTGLTVDLEARNRPTSEYLAVERFFTAHYPAKSFLWRHPDTGAVYRVYLEEEFTGDSGSGPNLWTWSASVVTIGDTDLPFEVRAHAIASTAIRVSWRYAGFAPVAVEWRAVGDTLWTRRPYTSSAYQDVVGLTERTEYEFRVVTKTFQVSGIASETTALGEPTNLVGDLIGSTASLVWERNSTQNTGVRVYRDSMLVGTLAAGATTFSETIEDPDETYVYTVFNTLGAIRSAPAIREVLTVETGTIRLSVDDEGFDPAKEAVCDGSEVSRATYVALAAKCSYARTATTTNGDAVIVLDSGASAIRAGMKAEGVGIPVGATVVSVSGSNVTLSANATADGSVTVTFWKFGNGDGSTTFNLPNLSGRFFLGAGNNGVSNRRVGESGGEESHELTVPEMPAHTHQVSPRSTNSSVSANATADPARGNSTGTTNSAAPLETTSAGTGTPFSILPPYGVGGVYLIRLV